MRILLLGGSGQVGREMGGLTLGGDGEIAAPRRMALDLRDAEALARAIAAEPWGAVINAAAYTDVERAESDEALAFAVNAEAPRQLAIETAQRGIPLIHLSTDYVFDGRKGTPYVEEDPVGPLNAYGRSKLAGEEGVRAANPRHVILRTAWVYSPFGRNFVRTILRVARERDRLTIVADQRGCPTAARDVAQTCLDIAQRCALDRERAHYGIYHLAGAGEATWFEFATAIIDAAGERLTKRPEIVPIRTCDYPTAAIRPADTRLDCARIIRDYGVTLRPWRTALEETIDRLLADKVNP
jgi:dTDP-4-dehydrorhamnose reductase